MGYPDLRKALLKRGWYEIFDKNNDDVHLKFALSSSEITQNTLRGKAMVNHCRGEGSLTSKTALIETLTESQRYWATWMKDEITIRDYSIAGIDSFFPKSFVITNIVE